MADLPISGLTAAGTLAGTEPLPIVQGGATKKTTVQDVADLGTFTKDANGNVVYQGLSPTLGTSCVRNIFYQASDAILGNGCQANVFLQGVQGITLGTGCIKNIFEMGVDNFVFGNNLQNVTIKSGSIGADYTNLTNYGFLYNLDYDSEIFRNPEDTANYHRYYDPTNDRIVLTLLAAPYTVSYIGGGGGGGDVYLANDQTFTGENTFAIGSGSKEPIIVTKGGNGAGIKVTKSSGSGDAIEVAEGSLSIADETASTIAHLDSNKRVKSLNTSTYPSLIELSYVKDVTSAIQTQFTNINNRLSNLIDIATDGAATSGTSNTYSTGGLITPDQILAGDCIEIINICRKSAINGTITVRFYANTVNSLAGSPILIATSAANVAATRQTTMQRFLRIKVINGTGAGTEVTNTSLAITSDYSGSYTSAVSPLAIDWTVNQYLIVAIQNGSGSDSSVSTMFKVRR
jgi:hypothetical protein